MDITTQTLLAADLADRWIDAILGEQPDVLLQADTDEPLTPETWRATWRSSAPR